MYNKVKKVLEECGFNFKGRDGCFIVEESINVIIIDNYIHLINYRNQDYLTRIKIEKDCQTFFQIRLRNQTVFIINRGVIS